MPVGAMRLLLGSLNNVVPIIIDGLPSYSISGKGQIVSDATGISTPSFSTLHTKKVGFSCWIKSPTTAEAPIFKAMYAAAAPYGGSTTSASSTCRLYTRSTGDTVSIQAAFGINNAVLTEASAGISDAAWHHIYAKIDTTQILEDDRLKLFVDGAQVGTYDTVDRLTLDSEVSIAWEDHTIIRHENYPGTNPKQYQNAVFSDTLPDISELYDAGNPIDIGTLPGLFSLLDVNGSDIFSDVALNFTWLPLYNISLIADIDIPS